MGQGDGKTLLHNKARDVVHVSAIRLRTGKRTFKLSWVNLVWKGSNKGGHYKKGFVGDTKLNRLCVKSVQFLCFTRMLIGKDIPIAIKYSTIGILETFPCDLTIPSPGLHNIPIEPLIDAELRQDICDCEFIQHSTSLRLLW